MTGRSHILNQTHPQIKPKTPKLKPKPKTLSNFKPFPHHLTPDLNFLSPNFKSFKTSKLVSLHHGADKNKKWFSGLNWYDSFKGFRRMAFKGFERALKDDARSELVWFGGSL